jgi:hypothetical protein
MILSIIIVILLLLVYLYYISIKNRDRFTVYIQSTDSTGVLDLSEKYPYPECMNNNIGCIAPTNNVIIPFKYTLSDGRCYKATNEVSYTQLDLAKDKIPAGIIQFGSCSINPDEDTRYLPSIARYVRLTRVSGDSNLILKELSALDINGNIIPAISAHAYPLIRPNYSDNILDANVNNITGARSDFTANPPIYAYIEIDLGYNVQISFVKIMMNTNNTLPLAGTRLDIFAEDGINTIIFSLDINTTSVPTLSSTGINVTIPIVNSYAGTNVITDQSKSFNMTDYKTAGGITTPGLLNTSAITPKLRSKPNFIYYLSNNRCIKSKNICSVDDYVTLYNNYSNLYPILDIFSDFDSCADGQYTQYGDALPCRYIIIKNTTGSPIQLQQIKILYLNDLVYTTKPTNILTNASITGLDILLSSTNSNMITIPNNSYIFIMFKNTILIDKIEIIPTANLRVTGYTSSHQIIFDINYNNPTNIDTNIINKTNFLVYDGLLSLDHYRIIHIDVQLPDVMTIDGVPLSPGPPPNTNNWGLYRNFKLKNIGCVKNLDMIPSHYYNGNEFGIPYVFYPANNSFKCLYVYLGLAHNNRIDNVIESPIFSYVLVHKTIMDRDDYPLISIDRNARGYAQVSVIEAFEPEYYIVDETSTNTLRYDLGDSTNTRITTQTVNVSLNDLRIDILVFGETQTKRYLYNKTNSDIIPPVTRTQPYTLPKTHIRLGYKRNIGPVINMQILEFMVYNKELSITDIDSIVYDMRTKYDSILP